MVQETCRYTYTGDQNHPETMFFTNAIKILQVLAQFGIQLRIKTGQRHAIVSWRPSLRSPSEFGLGTMG